MKFNNLIFILYFSCIINKSFKNGVYNIIVDDLYLSYYKKNTFLSDYFHQNTLFKIIKHSNNINEPFYSIEEIGFKKKLSFSKDKIIVLENNNNYKHLWNLKKINRDNFIIKSIENCYIKKYKLKIFCDDVEESEAASIKFVRIYSEVSPEYNPLHKEILKKEPIDVLIKYIDLRDSKLKRSGIHQIEKDYDNEELRYSIRGILNNIPWIRKIFILMPNEKVRFLKDYNLIKDKIIYVNDKDFLGHESSNFNAFLFRYWKMKKFGISDNIIIMDDDYFIGKKLQKSDFFYVENGKVLPAITTSQFIKIEKKYVKQKCEFFEKKMKTNTEEQNGDEFDYSKFLTFSFILNLFNNSLNDSMIIPKFTHNAIPVNLNEVKQIYDLVYMSPYKYTTLDCLYRIYGYIQFQILMFSYTFIKYKRKVKNIPSVFIQLNNSISANYKYPLFCINKGAGNFSFLNFYKQRIVMEYLFPFQSKYEIIDYSLINIAFNVTNSMDNLLRIYEKEKTQMIYKKEFYFLQIIIILNFLFIFIKIT